MPKGRSKAGIQKCFDNEVRLFNHGFIAVVPSPSRVGSEQAAQPGYFGIGFCCWSMVGPGLTGHAKLAAFVVCNDV